MLGKINYDGGYPLTFANSITNYEHLIPINLEFYKVQLSEKENTDVINYIMFSNDESKIYYEIFIYCYELFGKLIEMRYMVNYTNINNFALSTI